jgi:hypothetical protein
VDEERVVCVVFAEVFAALEQGGNLLEKRSMNGSSLPIMDHLQSSKRRCITYSMKRVGNIK